MTTQPGSGMPQPETLRDARQRSEPVPARSRFRHGTAVLVGGIVLVYAAVTILSMRQTSATFDEILLPAAGARGYATGDFDLVNRYHPRLMTYVYGLPTKAADPNLPANPVVVGDSTPFDYSQQLFFDQGNDGPSLLFRARLVAVAVGAALIVLVFVFVRRYYGGAPAVLAAGMIAFLPDIIAHGGIAYNDVAAALTLFAAVWALDRAATTGTRQRAVVAALLCAVALLVKYSAIALAPIALLLIGLEAIGQGDERRAYLSRILRHVPAAVVAAYALMVTAYLGDVMLTSYWEGFAFNVAHASVGHGDVPAWLLGRSSADGFWYFFPVAFLIKTPTAFHVLLIVAAAGLFMNRGSGPALLRSPLRGPVIAIVVFGMFLVTSRLNIGFRHAMPVLPFIVVIAAAGLAPMWKSHGRRLRLGIAALVVVQAASVLSWYPHFIPYTSEYFRDRDRGYRLLTDSSHDWGQALPLLRRFMEEENVSAVQLSYFGSADPAAYGVHYVPLPSFFDLPPGTTSGEAPRFIAVSATNLVGGYVDGAFAPFRTREPYRVLGHTVYIYETRVTDR